VRSTWARACHALTLAALAAAPAATAACQARSSPGPQAEDAPVCPMWRRETDAHLERMERRLLELVNQRRRAVRANTLSLEPRLSAVARRHSRAMASQRKMAHQLPGGPSADARLNAAGIKDWDAVSENIAMGQSVSYTSEVTQGAGGRTVSCHSGESLAFDIFRAWEASPGHSRNLRDPRFTHLGSGAAYDPATETVYVTHDFAKLVTCGYSGAPCCPPPEGRPGGVCQIPNRCLAGVCQVPPTPTPSPLPLPLSR
jgi:uncharacterized protein YkwD